MTEAAKNILGHDNVMMRSASLNVLVIDHSVVVRQTLASLLSSANTVINTAPDGIVAIQKMKRFRPHVIILEIDLPRMDGLTFLRRLMIENPIPVIVFSSHIAPGSVDAQKAIEYGAVNVVAKPNVALKENLEKCAYTLRSLLTATAAAVLPPVRPAADEAQLRRRARQSDQLPNLVIAIGASLGGTAALPEVLSALPLDTPGMVVVQHMPKTFTPSFARRLDVNCKIDVKEAQDGDEIKRGQALIAPGDLHINVVRTGDRFSVKLFDGPRVSRHKPSVDVLFKSVARAAGSRSVGIILTGMGSDGASGLLEMKQAGAVTIAQDEASCAVFGMPREAIARGAATRIVALHEIPSAILRAVSLTEEPRIADCNVSY